MSFILEFIKKPLQDQISKEYKKFICNGVKQLIGSIGRQTNVRSVNYGQGKLREQVSFQGLISSVDTVFA